MAGVEELEHEIVVLKEERGILHEHISRLKRDNGDLEARASDLEDDLDRLRFDFHMMDEHEDYDYEQFLDGGRHLRDVIAHLLYATGTYDLTDLKQAAIDAGLDL